MIQDRQTYLKVELDNILHNYNAIKSSLTNKDIMAVVKADAYGLGAKVVVKYLYENNVRIFGVATLEEALEIKEVANDSLILVLGVINPKNIHYAIDNDISLCCPSLDWLKEVVEQLKTTTKKLKLHLKIDSGMRRIGVSTEKEIKEVNKLLNNNQIELEGIFTHYANADAEDNFYDLFQKEQFTKLASHIDKKAKYIHQENTAATMRYAKDKSDFNLVRVGISLYGAYPSNAIKLCTNTKIKNVSSLFSEVVSVKKIDSHLKVGYGCTYESEREEYIATIPIGYRDGVLRTAQGYKVLINNELCEIVGRVCMDQLMVRCSENVKVGDKVLFYGEYNNNTLLINDYAKHIGTIPYEMYCILGSRVPRKYYIDGKETENFL